MDGASGREYTTIGSGCQLFDGRVFTSAGLGTDGMHFDKETNIVFAIAPGGDHPIKKSESRASPLRSRGELCWYSRGQGFLKSQLNRFGSDLRRWAL